MTLPIALERGRAADPSLLDQPLDANGPRESGDRLAGGRLRGSAVAAGGAGGAIGRRPCWATRRAGRRALQYGTTIGDLRLRARLLEYLERSDGQPAGRYKEALPRTIVTTGSAQLIYLVCEALLDPGDIVLVESPTYFVFLGPLETRGARAIRVPIDEGGMRIDELERDARAARERGAARAGQADLHDSRARQPDRDQPGRGATAAAWSSWHENGRRRIGFSCWRTLPTAGWGSTGAEPPSLWSLDREGDTVILARTVQQDLSARGSRSATGSYPKRWSSRSWP